MLWKFNQVYNPRRQLADHARPVRYELPLPQHLDVGDRRMLYVHTRGTTQGAPTRRTPD
ncbi:Magnesium-protoporphyrin IX monomethyl ester (Oxidative) cyclase OS=Streptomyces griseomycini OX=66895 GN=FHS37_006307 PE=4 SV=1 [Streptomyces griseomycini]